MKSKKRIMKKSKYKFILILILMLLVTYLVLMIINSYFGWYGYERWKYRMGTYGDKIESVNRGVFIKDLNYNSNIDLNYFKIYIEKGYWCGFHNLEETRFENKTKYPFQISLKSCDTIKNVIFNVINSEQYDSINNEILDVCIYLKEPRLKDTLWLKITTFDKKRDSIGYIKVWDKVKR